MRTAFAILLILALVPRGSWTQTSKPIPPGIREADKLPGPADLPPLNQSATRHPAPQLMGEQARSLAELAQSIPADIARFNNGVVPKDLNEKLKRIEKLSKTLRGELSN